MTSSAWQDAVRLLVPPRATETFVAAKLQRCVSQTTFGTRVVLVVSVTTSTTTSSASQGVRLPDDVARLPTGCHQNAHLAGSVVDLAARVFGNTVVSDTVVQAGAALVACGSVVASSDSTDGTTTVLPLVLSVGPESGGGRPLVVDTAAVTMVDVTRQLVAPDRVQIPKKAPSTTGTATNFNLLLSGAFVRHTPTVHGVVLHAGARVVAATAVTRTLLLPGALVANHCTVTDCLLQWKAHIVDRSTVDAAVLMECAAAGPATFCTQAVLGPDTHISAGEVHASVLGPNTNAHHQSLVIGVLWPHGRGNVGYGANVGSNHTGRLPDQEAAAPEGCFWGLTTCIVMPVNLSHAPYCVVAAGSTLTAPAKIHLPFSLVQTGTIVPGWVHAKSPYTVVRSAHKFATRRRAVRHAFYTGWKILRASTVQLCVQARKGLRDGDAAYWGNLECSERGRRLGMATYTDCIQRYCLQELLRLCCCCDGPRNKNNSNNGSDGHAAEMESAHDMVQRVAAALDPSQLVPITPIPMLEWAPFPWDESPAQETAYARSLLVQEFPLAASHHSSTTSTSLKHWIRQGLERLTELQVAFGAAVEKSKARDDTRGAATIPHYAAAHVAAADDPVIRRMHAETKRLQRDVQGVLVKLNVSTL